MIDSKWLLLSVSLLLFVGVLGLSCSIVSYRKRRGRNPVRSSTSKSIKTVVLPSKATRDDSPVQPKTISVPSSTPSAIPSPTVNKSLSTSSSQLTENDIGYLNKLFRTASDRSMWKEERLAADPTRKPRKVPSGQNQVKASSFVNK